jgi:diguanylate cyclase (GGDEF)-like protein/PAS domain S-box-containing protein
MFLAAMGLTRLDLRRDLDAAQMAIQSELVFVGSVVGDELRRGQYQRLDPLFREWGAANPRLNEVSVVGPDGFVISAYRHTAKPTEVLTLTLPIDYSYTRRATLHLTGNLDEVYERNATFRDRLLMLMLVVSGLLGLVLLLLLKRQEEARILQQRAVALDAANAALRESEEHLRTIIDIEPECIQLLDANGQLIEINPAGLAMLEAESVEQVAAKPMSAFMLAEHRPAFEDLMADVLRGNKGTLAFEIRGLKGTRRWLEMHAVPMTQRTGESVLLGVTRDITEHQEAEERLSRLAHYDALTGLPNRALFNERLGQCMIDAERHDRMVAVAFLDLDRFKDVNDTLGHEAGDLLLKSVAARLRGAVRRGDTLARLSGDEFAFVFADIKRAKDIARLAQKIIEVFTQPVNIAGRDLFVSASMGITLFPADAHEIRALLRNADMAMYRAKDAGRNTFKFYAAAMTAKAVDRLELANALRLSLKQGKFALHYQPITRCADGRVVGVEALVRWQSPEHGLVLPEHFIAIAEETGLIVPLGKWVLQAACAQLHTWQTNGFPDLRLSVNLSPRQFRQSELVQDVAQALADTGVAAHTLELEITESVLAQGDEAEGVLRAVSQSGVHISIDDFGTGYSSLSYLKRFPIDTLKIDQVFVKSLPGDADDAAIATAIIAMAHKLGIEVVAEGVESVEQLRFFKVHGCDYLQGFHLSPPLTAEGITALLRQSSSPATNLLELTV